MEKPGRYKFFILKIIYMNHPTPHLRAKSLFWVFFFNFYLFEDFPVAEW